MTTEDIQTVHIQQLQAKQDRTDLAIEKLSEVSSHLSQMIMVHETKLDNIEELIRALALREERHATKESDNIEKLHTKISALRTEAETGRKEMKKDLIQAVDQRLVTMSELETRVKHIETWKWKIGGMGAIVIILIPLLLAFADWIVNHTPQ